MAGEAEEEAPDAFKSPLFASINLVFCKETILEP